MENVNSLPQNLNLLRMLLGKFQVSISLAYAIAGQGAISWSLLNSLVAAE